MGLRTQVIIRFQKRTLTLSLVFLILNVLNPDGKIFVTLILGLGDLKLYISDKI